MSLFQQCNDVMLMCYLSTITKGANSLNEVCLFYLHPFPKIKEHDIKVSFHSLCCLVSTGSEGVSVLICLEATRFVLPRVFTPKEA